MPQTDFDWIDFWMKLSAALADFEVFSLQSLFPSAL
jgi:hypothetical protein